MASTLFNDEATAWFDQIGTPLNACSLETFVPISDGPGETKHGEDTNFRDAVPLIIGCYQLNETSFEGLTADAVVAQSEEDSAEDASATTAGVGLVQKSSREGELRLYMIPSTSTASPENNARENKTVRFTDAACVVHTESGVLDGKWKRRRTSRQGSIFGRSETPPIFASACASGKIHVHSLEIKKSSSSWILSHLASSDEPHPDDKASLCLSLAWNDFLDADGECGDYTDERDDLIVSSYSNGTLALHAISRAKFAETSEEAEYDSVNHRTDVICIEETQRWSAHEMFGCPSEVWACSFLRGDENIVLSGADDVRFDSHFAHEYIQPVVNSY
jgi:hypothetical protein